MTPKKEDNVDLNDEVLSEKEKVAAKYRADDHTAWETWKQDPTQTTMRPLMQRFEPLFRSKVRQWKAPNVNDAAFKANLKVQAVDAFHTFDPNKGAALRTHLENRLKKSMRFNMQNQNYAYIPEGKSQHIGRINGASDELQEELGRVPTSYEIAAHLNPTLSGRNTLSAKKVEQIQNAQYNDVLSSSFESDPTPHAISREREVVGLLRPALSPEEQQVYDNLYGIGGVQRTSSTTNLAKILGKSPSQISRLRTSIMKKFEKYK